MVGIRNAPVIAGIDYAVAHMHPKNLAYAYVARVEIEPRMQPTFKRYRGLGNTRRFYPFRRSGREADQIEFAQLRRRVHGAAMHLFGNRFVDQINHEFFRFQDVAHSVFCPAAGTRVSAEYQNRRIFAQYIEVAERRSVHHAVCPERGYQRDRSRYDEADQNLVALWSRQAEEIDFHDWGVARL